MWQLVRQISHRLYVGKWLFCRAGGIKRKTTEKSDVKTSARDAAMAYFKLHQLHLLGKQVHISPNILGLRFHKSQTVCMELAKILSLRC